MNAPSVATGEVVTSGQINAEGAGLTDIELKVSRCAGNPIRILVFTSLYPNVVQPRHGVFVEERLRHLVDAGRVTATVVAPVPWFPFRHRRFGRYATYAQVPRRERRYGIEVLHPRYPVIPKLGMNVAPSLLYRTMLPVLRNLRASGTRFDLIDAHYFYPDGVAATRLGLALGKPVVITARGNDVTWIPRWRAPRRQIQYAAERASAIVTVSQALKDKLVTLGVAPERVTVLRNGVDLDRFKPQDRGAIRSKLGLSGTVWLAVGYLIERKGVHFAIEALARAPDTTLLIAGDGPEEHRLRRMVEELGLATRVRFLGAIPHAALCEYYNAADALVLASSREGMPNVALESIACGTPVVAAPFDGATEVIGVPDAGQIAESRSGEALFAAWSKLRDSGCGRSVTRQYAETFGWGPTVRAQQALYETVLRARPEAYRGVPA